MSVASRNPFAILDDSPEPVATPPKKETPAPAPAAQTQKPRSNASRGGKYYQRGGKPRDPAAAGEEPSTEDGARRKFDGESRGRGRGRGRGDRGRGGRGRGGDRLDRHSATGKTDSDKKVSQGWGAEEGSAELKAEESGAADAANDWGAAPAAADDAWAAPAAPADGAADPWAANGAAAAPAEGDTAAAEGGDGDRRRREREPEEEDNTLSYEQYLAQKKEAENLATPALDVRQANDGGEDWQKSLQELKKAEEEDAYFVGKTKSATAPKTRAKKEEKVYLEIDGRFERPNRGRGRGGDRGDRGRGEGRGRGGRGRGGDRGAPRGGPRSNGQTAALNVDDETAFPSLS